MKRSHLTYVLIFITFVFILASRMTVAYAEGFNPVLADTGIGSKAPDFTIEDISGNKVSLSSFKGKPVLLNFWATWCPYCRKERPHLNKLYNDYRDKGLIILSVSTDPAAKVREYLKNTPADFIVLSDSNGTASSLYGVEGLPTSYLVSREGIIKQRFVGFREWSEPGSKMFIDKLLNN